MHPLGAAALSGWGLLDRLTATGCPPIHTYDFDFGPFTISGSPGTEKSPVAFCPRRTILDKLLVDAAAEAGAEVREGFAVEEVLIEDGRAVGIKGRSRHGGSTIERARVVIGADGLRSFVAEAVRPEQYDEKPPLCVGYYTYWSGLPMHGRSKDQRTRDARVKPMYEFTCELATLQPPPPEMQQLLAAVHGNQKAMDDFARMNAGTISPAEFFAPENLKAIAAAA